MPMTPEKSKPTKLCPTCGTRVSEDATRCLVCGTDLSAAEKTSKPPKAIQGSRMPAVTLNLPALMGLIMMVLVIGAGIVYFSMRQVPGQAASPSSTGTPTITVTPSPTLTPTPVTPTVTNTPEASPTPYAYTVKSGDLCGAIAATFGVSIQSIVLLNNLPADCGTLTIGQKLLIPQPTPTVTPPATSTKSAEEATRAACQTIDYTVQENDTLSSISLNYAVPMDVIREWNGRVSDTVRFGEKLTIPLCKRSATPGPTATATLPPPYTAPNLLLPADGSPFTLADDTITLQWATVGALRSNEAYAVSIEDVTQGQGKVVEYVNDTKFIVPASLRPNDTRAHVFRWTVLTVRQTGTDNDGDPIWEAAGAASAPRVFTWTGAGGSSGAATPAP